MNAISNAGIFLISLIFDFFIYILLLRLFLQKCGVSYYNPLSQLTLKTTNVFILPLRRIIPSHRGWDIPIIFLILVFQVIESLLILRLETGFFPHLYGSLLVSLGGIINKASTLYFYALIFRVFMSWVTGLQRNPIGEAVYLMTEPLLSPIRKWTHFAGFDFSPLIVLILLQLLYLLFIAPLISLGMRLAF